MINPVIFSVKILGLTLTLHWYGVFVALGIFVAAWLAEKEVVRRGEKADHVWNALLLIIPLGIIGARLWYVANATLGGNSYYLQNPLQIFNLPEGGLHFYGGLLFGAAAIIWYIWRNKLDIWLFLDSAAPVTLIGQAVARPANFINQELYGQPTDLPWGIPIESAHRIPPYNNLAQYPLETTRFHPTFAYEIIWNVLAGGLLLWAGRRFKDRLKPGTLFYAWLILAGIGRALIETFRPDQPRIPGTDLSYTRLIALLMIAVGGFMMLVRYEIVRLPFLKPGPESYHISDKGVNDQKEEEPQAT
jgi:phosphatidylglycerol:prolipoprotein diacylglycerol transferase